MGKNVLDTDLTGLSQEYASRSTAVILHIQEYKNLLTSER